MQQTRLPSVTTFLQYPFTWGAFLLIALAHSCFAWWFSPTPFMQAMTTGLDGGCLPLFIAFAHRTTAFRDFCEERRYRAAIKAVADRLPEGTTAFRTAALACLTLSQQLHRDFKDEPSLHAFEELVQNVITMAENHRTLYGRAQQFGTAEQKARMQGLLEKQVQTMQQTLENLQAFGGNLTILSVQFEKTVLAARELQSLNQGLQEVIQEMVDA